MADLVVLNADVRTVDPAMPRARGFAVRDGRFVAVGAGAALEALIGATTTVVDAGGDTVVPGFVDGHTHLRSGSSLAVGVDLTGLTDTVEWLERIAVHVEMLEAGAWVVGGAWDHNLTATKRLPDAAMLDGVAPDNPVALRDIDGHTTWVNSLALELAGITADSVAPPGGEIQLDPSTGQPTGILFESASDYVSRVPGFQNAFDTRSGLLAAGRKAARLGITAVHDMSGSFDVFLELAESGELPLRIWQGAVLGGDRGAELEAEVRELASQRDRIARRLAGLRAERGPLFELGYIKSILDGVLSTRTAILLAPYADDPQARPEPITTPGQLRTLVRSAHGSGFPVAVHAIGDGAVADVLDVFAATAASRSEGLLPDRIEHIELVALEDVARFRELGVVASMQPHHVTCCMGNYILDRIGPERVKNAYVWRTMLDGNVHLVLGTDWPTATFDPLEQIADALFRVDVVAGNGVEAFDEGMTLTFDEALHAYTQAGADAAGWGAELGSVALGKWADFVVLTASVPDEPDDSFRELAVRATYLAGRRVYGAD